MVHLTFFNINRNSFCAHLDSLINQVISQLLCQRPGTERLASEAKVGAAVLHRDPLDGAAANGARGSCEFRCS